MSFQQHDGVVVEMVEVFPWTGLRQAVYERDRERRSIEGCG